MLSSIEKVGDGYSEKHADGYSCFNMWCDSMELMGLQLFKTKVTAESDDGTAKVEYSDPIKNKYNMVEQLRTFAADGERAYQGEHLGMRHYMHSDHGLGDKTISFMVDPPHCVDKLVEKGQEKLKYTTETVHMIIKAVYSFLSKSGMYPTPPRKYNK